MKSIAVRLERTQQLSHEILIGRDIMDRVALLMLRHRWASSYVLVADSHVASLHASSIMETLSSVGLRVQMLEVPPGEGSKSMEICLDLIRKLMLLGADRSFALLALGGGVVGDLTGFVASMYMRGIPYVQVPTTLLAQVDSSIGGKTGIDLPEGKNLVGTFHQPRAVFVDLAFLDTLSQAQIREGLAEVIKYGLIEDPELLTKLESSPELWKNQDPGAMEELVTKCCVIKKGFVEMDEMDRGVRRILNFGHTVGHAVEAESGYRLSHGEAVSVGMAAETRISARLGHLPWEEALRLESLLKSMGLPVRLPRGLSVSQILSRMEKDKKREGGKLPFVLLRRPGLPFLDDSVGAHLVRDVLEELGE